MSETPKKIDNYQFIIVLFSSCEEPSIRKVKLFFTHHERCVTLLVHFVTLCHIIPAVQYPFAELRTSCGASLGAGSSVGTWFW